MNLVFQAKLYPTPTQEAELFRFLSVCRWIYNRCLEHRIKAWKRRQESVNYYAQQTMLTAWRSRVDWLRSVPAQVERNALRRVDRGMQGFFRRCKTGEKPGFPRFKSRDRWRSFEVLQPGKYLRKCSRVFIPGVGPIKYRGMPEFDGSVRGMRVVHKPSGWHVQLIVALSSPAAETREPERAVGIDVGLTNFATLSTGETVENPRFYRKAQKRLRFLQRIVSRRRKGSGRYRRAVQRVARFHQRIADSRRDWLHKLTKRLIGDYDLIAVEDFRIKGLSRSRASKSILDAAWAAFLHQLTYKAENAGVSVVKVSARGTSQECSACGATVLKELREREHRCSCGYVACRDVNAALNILRRASPGTRGESVVAGAGDCHPAGAPR